MCVALPGKVISIEGGRALVDFGGSRVSAMAGLVDVSEGDRVLVHAGCIMEKLKSDEAWEMEELYKEIMDIR
ncbi:MAG: HypC/HybG/HupF family hydrogenase formation chaperone [Lachnospiraceae bacterium]|nr:HypC/HybG/HupF family hydrogenase formation chaperone [Lachnospiraceae bacterium]